MVHRIKQSYIVSFVIRKIHDEAVNTWEKMKNNHNLLASSTTSVVETSTSCEGGEHDQLLLVEGD